MHPDRSLSSPPPPMLCTCTTAPRECQQFDDCAKYAPAKAAGKPVFSVEYDTGAFLEACEVQDDLGITSILKVCVGGGGEDRPSPGVPRSLHACAGVLRPRRANASTNRLRERRPARHCQAARLLPSLAGLCSQPREHAQQCAWPQLPLRQNDACTPPRRTLIWTAVSRRVAPPTARQQTAPPWCAFLGPTVLGQAALGRAALLGFALKHLYG